MALNSEVKIHLGFATEAGTELIVIIKHLNIHAYLAFFLKSH